MTNQFLGLARGPIDHQSSSVINAISNGAITMGSVLRLNSTITTTEILPRVEEATLDGDITYGIGVGGDTDGIYGDGSAATDDLTRATAGAGQGVVVVTQGRCLARVKGVNPTGAPTAISIGDSLGASDQGDGILVSATNQTETIARALQPVAVDETDMIAVDVQREGKFA